MNDSPDYTWRTLPNSRQHWLYKNYRNYAVCGLVYEINPTAFTLYLDIPTPAERSNRDFIAQVSTLDEAKSLLITVVSSQNI